MRTARHLPAEAGQVFVFVLLALGLFLLSAMAFAVDFGNLWFHRQAAQNAADAGCMSGAMDILVATQSAATGKQGFTIGTAFDCATTTAATPCKYAALNGYSGTNSVPGNHVLVSFPASDPNVSSTTPPLPPASMAANPFIRVDVIDHVQTFFWGLLSGNSTQDVRAFAVCGALLLQSSTPILVLDPANTATLSVQGTPNIVIYGGPSKSIQVNSSSSSGVSVGGSALIDLSKGGPNLTGSSIGVAGGPFSAPGGINFGTTGSWSYPSAVMSDPFATLCAPGQSGCPQVNGSSAPAVPGAPQIPADEKGCKSIPCSISYHDAGHGCSDSGGCDLYTAGFYGSGITIKKNNTAVFDPGLYYVVDGLSLDSNSTLRPGTGPGDGSGGTVFYFSGAQSISVNANSGHGNGYGNSIDPFYASSLKCTGTSTLPGNLPATTAIQGNILLAPCTGYYGDPLGSSDPQGVQRGMLFFQDRSASGVTATWGGGGQFLVAGIIYIHHCNASGTGKSCGAPTTYYDAAFSLSGNSCSGTYVLGSIIVDNLTLGGSSCITMDLNPNAAYWIMKASLIR